MQIQELSEQEELFTPPSVSPDYHKIAVILVERWWDEQKISYNFQLDTDVNFLAYVIEHRQFPDRNRNVN